MIIGTSNIVGANTPTAAFGSRGTPTEANAPFVSDAAAPSPQVLFNPRIRFDSEANVIVMEFRNRESGEIARSVPSERQLQAYIEAQRLPAPRQESTGAVEERGRTFGVVEPSPAASRGSGVEGRTTGPSAAPVAGFVGPSAERATAGSVPVAVTQTVRAAGQPTTTIQV